jgi:hypothetical protein
MEHAVSTVSITTVEIQPMDGGARLLLVEHGAFLDGLEQPSWREQGTDRHLDALGEELAALDLGSRLAR